MITEDRLEEQRRLLTAIKAAWRLQPRVRLSKLLITVVEDLGPSDFPPDLREVDDKLLLRALEANIIRAKSINNRTKKRA